MVIDSVLFNGGNDRWWEHTSKEEQPRFEPIKNEPYYFYSPHRRLDFVRMRSFVSMSFPAGAAYNFLCFLNINLCQFAIYNNLRRNRVFIIIFRSKQLLSISRGNQNRSNILEISLCPRPPHLTPLKKKNFSFSPNNGRNHRPLRQVNQP